MPIPTSATSARLHPDVVASLPPEITRPAAGRSHWRTGIVHLGIGAFHRAHQAVYTERAALARADDRWGILGVTQRSRGVVEQLRPQQGLYGVLVSGAGTEHLQIAGAVLDAAFRGEEHHRVLETVASPHVHIVSLTITEKGYCTRGDGSLDLDRPDVRGDVATVQAILAGQTPPVPQTGIGLLACALAFRYRAGGQPVTVLCCDNLVDNGSATRRLVNEFVQAAPGSGTFGSWLEESISFASSMVDRIVPATTEEHRRRAQRISGLHDAALVVAEPFSQWVIEDDFAAARPAWEQVGAQLVPNVTIYERTKLRLLNGTHSMIAYRGALAGHRTIAEAIADPALRAEARALIDTDLIPTIAGPGGSLPEDLDLDAYRESVLERFANPATGHLTVQVAMDGSQKLPIRLLAAARERLAAGSTPVHVARAVGAWMHYVHGRVDARGTALEVSDPLLGQIDEALAGSERGLVERVLGIEAIFGADLREHAEFVAAVRDGYRELAGG